MYIKIESREKMSGTNGSSSKTEKNNIPPDTNNLIVNKVRKSEFYNSLPFPPGQESVENNSCVFTACRRYAMCKGKIHIDEIVCDFGIFSVPVVFFIF
jgi:hypothetical protein